MAQVFASAIDADRCEVECLHPDHVRPLLGRSLGGDGSRSVAELFAALADPSRARILHLLAISERELCVCDMALVLGMGVSALSHQLRALRERGAVSRRKAGRIAYYRLVDDHLRRLVLDAAVHVAEGAA
ncbi:MAG TPA: metalloregulator ArsR/SmtB family transcription factor [Candidatus Dormibacteraeota bacterium]|nr:metalloregulator ArsR/SmtB family transcription factor [Candidatus Dormibacteraeota bacterium]